MNLSPNIAMRELLRSFDHPKLATPAAQLPWDVVVNLTRLAVLVLQPMRDRYGKLRVTSGYRSLRLQHALTGRTDSTHTSGRAADIVFPEASMVLVWSELKQDPKLFPLDRVAFYPETGHLHVEVAPHERGPQHLFFEARPDWRRVDV